MSSRGKRVVKEGHGRAGAQPAAAASRWRRIALGGGVVAAAGLLVFMAVIQSRPVRPSDQRNKSMAEPPSSATSQPEDITAMLRAANQQVLDGKVAQAIEAYRAALAIKPDDAGVHNALGRLLVQERRFPEAIHHFSRAIAIRPEYVEARTNLGVALYTQGDVDGAIRAYRAALKVNEAYALAHNHLATALVQQRQIEEGIAHYRRAVAIDPSYEAAHRHLGMVLEQEGRVPEAIEHYRAALQLRPDDPQACNNLAWLLATSPEAELRDGAEAVRLAERACQAKGTDRPTMALFLGTLSAAYAEVGRFQDAVATAERGQGMAADMDRAELAERLGEYVKLYRAGRPVRRSAGGDGSDGQSGADEPTGGDGK